MADPAVYENGEKVAELAKQFEAAKDEAVELSQRWESLASKLENS